MKTIGCNLFSSHSGVRIIRKKIITEMGRIRTMIEETRNVHKLLTATKA
jgi:hypothetical protein